jgi:SAM-dependent methyltransferase
MFTGANTDRAWKLIGRDDPYFGVLTGPEYRRDRLTEQALQSFFHSGACHVQQLLDDIRTHLDSEFCPRRALDFGCGVGRLVVNLGKCCTEVLGLDVSDGMLAEARANCARVGLPNVTIARADDGLSGAEGQFNLIHSYLVFQHIPVARGEKILARMLELLEPGGVVAWQFVIARDCSPYRKAVTWLKTYVPLANAVSNLLQGEPWSWPMMQMNRYDLSRVLHLLHQHGCDSHFARTGKDGQYIYAFLLAQKHG